MLGFYFYPPITMSEILGVFSILEYEDPYDYFIA